MDKKEYINKEPYKIVYKGGSGEIEEKKSRFIANIAPVESEEEALAFIEAMKKKYWDARHNCFAYVIGERAGLVRCSDDGEPQGTAGRPMLEVLTGQGVCNLVVVVTRYFGGVLLGTGGLVRAYTQAVQEGLLYCDIRTMRFGAKYQIHTDYNGIGKIQYILGKSQIEILDTEYTDKVVLTVMLPDELENRILKEITEVTAGKSTLILEERCFYMAAN